MEQTISDKEVWQHFFDKHSELFSPVPVEKNTEKIMALMGVERFYENGEPNTLQDITGEIKLIWRKIVYGIRVDIFQKGKCKASYTYNRDGHLICVSSKKPKQLLCYYWNRDNRSPYLKVSSTGDAIKFVIRQGEIYEEQINVNKKRRR